MFIDYWKSLSSTEKKELAQVVNSKVSYLRHVANGRHIAGIVLAKKLHDATEGIIDKHKLRPDFFIH